EALRRNGNCKTVGLMGRNADGSAVLNPLSCSSSALTDNQSARSAVRNVRDFLSGTCLQLGTGQLIETFALCDARGSSSWDRTESSGTTAISVTQGEATSVHTRR